MCLFLLYIFYKAAGNFAVAYKVQVNIACECPVEPVSLVRKWFARPVADGIYPVRFGVIDYRGVMEFVALQALPFFTENTVSFQHDFPVAQMQSSLVHLCFKREDPGHFKKVSVKVIYALRKIHESPALGIERPARVGPCIDRSEHS